MRLLEPLTRNVPSISVATHGQGTQRGKRPASRSRKICFYSPFSFKNRPLHKPRPPMIGVNEYFLLERKSRRGGQRKRGNQREGVDAPLGYDNRNVTPNIQPSACVRRRNLHTRIPQALLQRTSKHRSRRWGHVLLGQRLNLRDRAGVMVRRRRAGLLRRSDMLPPRAKAGFAVALIAVFSSHTFSLLLLRLVWKREKDGRRCRKRKREGRR